jgi:hypothetical protein
MTASEALRGWALYARSLAERTGQPAEFDIPGGAHATYILGEGLTYVTPAGSEFRYPESALEEEQWAVAS